MAEAQKGPVARRTFHRLIGGSRCSLGGALGDGHLPPGSARARFCGFHLGPSPFEAFSRGSGLLLGSQRRLFGRSGLLVCRSRHGFGPSLSKRHFSLQGIGRSNLPSHSLRPHKQTG